MQILCIYACFPTALKHYFQECISVYVQIMLLQDNPTGTAPMILYFLLAIWETVHPPNSQFIISSFFLHMAHHFSLQNCQGHYVDTYTPLHSTSKGKRNTGVYAWMAFSEFLAKCVLKIWNSAIQDGNSNGPHSSWIPMAHRSRSCGMLNFTFQGLKKGKKKLTKGVFNVTSSIEHGININCNFFRSQRKSFSFWKK